MSIADIARLPQIKTIIQKNKQFEQWADLRYLKLDAI